MRLESESGFVNINKPLHGYLWQLSKHGCQCKWEITSDN